MNKVCKVYKNGIKHIHYYIPFLNSIDIAFLFNVGFANEYKKEEFGIAHYLEHMTLQESKKFPDHKKAEDLLFKLGYFYNAWTFYTNTAYFCTGTNKNYEGALEVLQDLVFNPLILSGKVEKERGIIMEELKMNLSNPQSRLSRKMQSRFMYGTPYAHNGLGTKKTIQSISRKMLKNFHKTYYSANNSHLITYGGLTFDEVTEKTDQFLADIHTAEIPSSPKMRVIAKEYSDLILDLDLDSVLFNVYYKTKKVENVKQYLGLIYLMGFLFAGRSSLVNEVLYYDKNLISNYDYQIYPARDLLFIYFSTSVEHKKLNRLKEIYNKTIDNYKKEFTEEAFDRTKGYLLGRFKRTLENFNTSSFPAFDDIFEFILFESNYGFELNPKLIVNEIKNVNRDEILDLWKEFDYLNNRLVGIGK